MAAEMKSRSMWIESNIVYGVPDEWLRHYAHRHTQRTYCLVSKYSTRKRTSNQLWFQWMSLCHTTCFTISAIIEMCMHASFSFHFISFLFHFLSLFNRVTQWNCCGLTRIKIQFTVIWNGMEHSVVFDQYICWVHFGKNPIPVTTVTYGNGT